MMLFAKFGAAIAAPFLLFAGFWGFGHTATTTPPYHQVTASSTMSSNASSTEASSSVKIRTGLWNGHPRMPIPVHHSTTTPSTTLTLAALSPSSGEVGTQITLTGTGFSSDSIVHFGPGAIKGEEVNSTGTSITFTVPSTVGPYCTAHMACPMYLMLVTPNTYNVSVQNGTTTSNTETFTVTGSQDL